MAFAFQIPLVLLRSLRTEREKLMNCNEYDELYKKYDKLSIVAFSGSWN
jgi:hypothetical protein